MGYSGCSAHPRVHADREEREALRGVCRPHRTAPHRTALPVSGSRTVRSRDCERSNVKRGLGPRPYVERLPQRRMREASVRQVGFDSRLVRMGARTWVAPREAGECGRRRADAGECGAGWLGGVVPKAGLSASCDEKQIEQLAQLSRYPPGDLRAFPLRHSHLRTPT